MMVGGNCTTPVKNNMKAECHETRKPSGGYPLNSTKTWCNSHWTASIQIYAPYWRWIWCVYLDACCPVSQRWQNLDAFLRNFEWISIQFLPDTLSGIFRISPPVLSSVRHDCCSGVSLDAWCPVCVAPCLFWCCSMVSERWSC